MRVSSSAGLMLALLAMAGLTSFHAAQADPVAGNGSAIFINPVTEPGSVYSGAGTSDITWGTIGFRTPANELSFAGSAFNSTTDTPFKLGTLKYFNGSTATGTNIDGVDLQTTLAFTVPGGLGSPTFTFNIPITSTPNTNNQITDADYITLANSFPGQTFTIGSNVYTLALTGFQNVDATNGYLAGPGNDELHVYEDASGSADLYGKVTLASNNPAAVPEPSQSAAMIVGIFGLAGLAIARRRKATSAQ